MLNRYSLADHTVKVTFPEGFNVNGTNLGGLVLTFGGAGNNGIDGSFLGEIAVSRSRDTWTTEGDVTGSWVHNKSLDRTGTVTLNLRQISDDVVRLQMLANAFELNDSVGCQIIVFSKDTPVAQADDCYISKIPDQSFGDSAAMQSWGWTAGRVTFPRTDATWGNERA